MSKEARALLKKINDKKNAIRGLREEARDLRILGNYSIDGQI